MYDGGFAGKIAFVNLSTGEVKKEALDESVIKKFIGGEGINTKLAWDLIKPGIDPFSPDNPIIIGVGPLVGTSAPSSSKVMFTTKLLTGVIDHCVAGMHFGSMMKWAGYDHIVITGKANSPVYLKVFDDNIEMCDAKNVWGKDIFETTDELWEKEGYECSIYAIGQAGERLIGPSVGFVDRCAHAGKGGLSAVMGSKNLKAIVMRGTKGINISKQHDPKTFIEMTSKLYDELKTHRNRDTVLEAGLLGFTPFMMMTYGGYPNRNWAGFVPGDEFMPKFGPDALKKAADVIPIASSACASCCNHGFRLKEGKVKGMTHSSTVFDLLDLGVRFGFKSMEESFECLDKLNRYGLDVQTSSMMFDYLIELYEQGIIASKDTDGLELKYDFDTIMKLTDKVINREGIGDVMARGWPALFERFGEDTKKYAIQMKNTSPALEPRLGIGTESWVYATGFRGQDIWGASPSLFSPGMPQLAFKRYWERTGFSQEPWERVFPGDKTNVSRLSKYTQDETTLLNCVGLCARGWQYRAYNLQNIAQLYTCLTGIEIKPEELQEGAERVFNLNKVLNVKEGWTRKDDTFPHRWLNEPMKGGGKELWLKDYDGETRIDPAKYEQLLDEYYEERGWDKKEGVPTKETLQRLGLEEYSI